MRVELELRNLPQNRIMEYLVEAGGALTGECSVKGDGWTAILEEMEPAQLVTIRVPRDRLMIDGESPDIVERIERFMRLKTMRGGG